MRRFERGCAAALGALLLLAVRPAAADACRRIDTAGHDADERPCPADGVYGRLDGDLDLGLGAGAESDFDGVALAVRTSAHWFSTAGLWGSYSDALGGAALGARRSAAAGVDLRPLFVARLSNDLEQGPPAFDLLLDSTSLGVGVFWAEPAAGSFGDVRGLEMTLGLGVPFTGRASGPWLETRGRLRWPESSGTPEGAVVLLLSWHAVVLSPLVDD